jgi:hypothetical protein
MLDALASPFCTKGASVIVIARRMFDRGHRGAAEVGAPGRAETGRPGWSTWLTSQAAQRNP